MLMHGSLYLLVVSAERADDTHYEQSVGRFLDGLQASAPGALVLLVLSQCDRLVDDWAAQSGGGGR